MLNRFLLLVLLFILLFIMACSFDKRNDLFTKFQKVESKSSLVRKIDIDYERHFNFNRLIIEENVLYILQPLKSKVDFISLEDGRVTKEGAIRKTEPQGSTTYLKGGMAIDLMMTDDRYYLLETGTPKILEYNSDYELTNTYHLDLSFFVQDSPGVYKLMDGYFYVSTIDDFQGRVTYRKRYLKKEDPILIAYNLEKKEIRKVIKAGTYLKGAETDSLPFFSMTAYDEDFYLTSKYDATLHRFNKHGEYISKDISYANYIRFNEETVNSNTEMGIFDFFINSKSITYFIEREATKNEPSKFEVVCFDLQKRVYWIYELKKNNVLISYADGQLHYLEQTDEGNSIVTIEFRQ